MQSEVYATKRIPINEVIPLQCKRVIMFAMFLVFGSSLVALLKREKIPSKTIPTALETMVDAIKASMTSNGVRKETYFFAPDLQVEGIFRISCSIKDLLAVKEAIEKEGTKGYCCFCSYRYRNGSAKIRCPRCSKCLQDIF